MWICDYCLISNKATQFSDQSEFTKHLKTHHLQRYSNKRGIIYRCCFGNNGICGFATYDHPCEFETEKSYENHLLKRHLKSIKVSEDPYKISDSTTIKNSINYREVKNLSISNQQKWTSHHSVINLPAVLNDPKNRQLDIFSRTWGDAFEKSEPHPCQHLKPPDKSIFVEYIKKVRSSLKYRENMFENKNSESDLVKVPDNSIFLSQKPDLDNVPKIFFQSDFNLNSKDVFLSVIPIFLNLSDNSNRSNNPFTLLDNTLHYQLTNNTTNSKPTPVKSQQRWLTDNAVNKMNDKLSFYLDIVEINIAKQVSKKANSFFEAVTTQDKVRDKLVLALSQITEVRKKLSDADSDLTKNHMSVLILAQRKKNLQILLNQLQLVKTIYSSQTAIQSLLSSNDLCGVLDLISDTEKLLLAHSDSSVTNSRSVSASIVGKLHCLKHVKAQLHEMRLFVQKMVQQEYLNAITNQLRVDDDWVTSNTTNDMSNDALEIDYQLVPSLLAMLRIYVYSPHDKNLSMHTFIQLYFEDAIEQSKTIVKSRVLQAYYRCCQQDNNLHMPINEDNLSTTLADQMRSLDFNQWIDLMHIIINDLLQLLHKVKVGCFTMIETITNHDHSKCSKLNILSQINSATNDITKNQNYNLPDDTISILKKLPINVVDEIIQRVVKLVKARSKNCFLEKLMPAQLVQLDLLLRQDFLDKLCYCCNLEMSINSDKPTLLDATKNIVACVHEHAIRFITRFHNEHKEKLVLLLDTDLWRPAEVPSQIQDMAGYISKHSKGVSCPDRNGLNNQNSIISNDWSNQKSDPYLHLDGQKFTLASAALMLFQMIVEYCTAGQQLSKMNNNNDNFVTISPTQQISPFSNSTSANTNSALLHEIFLSHLTSLLECFNSQSCQLVLGAKARRLVELETISARNLALVARCLELLLLLIPRIRYHFVELGSVKQFYLTQLDQVQSAIKDHVDKINNKLVELLEQRVETKLSLWSCRPPAPSPEIRAICQQFIKMHEAVCGIFSPESELNLFRQVHNSVKAMLRLRIIHLHVIPNNGPQHGIVMSELAFYMSQLTTICGLKSFKDGFQELWK